MESVNSIVQRTAEKLCPLTLEWLSIIAKFEKETECGISNKVNGDCGEGPKEVVTVIVIIGSCRHSTPELEFINTG